MTSTAIDPVRVALWDSCDTVIKQGVATFIEVGNALLMVRRKDLWKDRGFDSFASCCEQVWGLKKTYAYDLSNAAEVNERIADSAIAETKPTNVAQLKQLAKLPAAEQSQAWADAVATSPDGDPTARDVKAAVERISTTKPTRNNFTCRNCYGHELSDDGECCERCKEPVVPPKAKHRFNATAARELLFDTLDGLLAKWPEDQHAEFYEACITYGNERKDA